MSVLFPCATTSFAHLLVLNRALGSVRESLGFAPAPAGDVDMREVAEPAVAEPEGGLQGEARIRVEESAKMYVTVDLTARQARADGRCLISVCPLLAKSASRLPSAPPLKGSRLLRRPMFTPRTMEPSPQECRPLTWARAPSSSPEGQSLSALLCASLALVLIPG